MPVELKTVGDIVREVAAKYDLSPMVILGHSRIKTFARPRQEAYYRCIGETGLSLPKIAKEFGNRHHTTILQGSRVFEDRESLAESQV